MVLDPDYVPNHHDHLLFSSALEGISKNLRIWTDHLACKSKCFSFSRFWKFAFVDTMVISLNPFFIDFFERPDYDDVNEEQRNIVLFVLAFSLLIELGGYAL
jgi:hypothetical protein